MDNFVCNQEKKQYASATYKCIQESGRVLNGVFDGNINKKECYQYLEANDNKPS